MRWSFKRPNFTSYVHPGFHFLAGLSTGVLSAFLLQPADLLKTRLQQSHSNALIPTLQSILSQPNAVQSLWRGTLPSVIRTGFGSALYFSTLNTLRSYASPISSLDASESKSRPMDITERAKLSTSGSVSTSASPSKFSAEPEIPYSSNGAMSSARDAIVGSENATSSLPPSKAVASSSALPQISKTGNLLAGAAARAFAGFVLMPITVIKVRYESSLYASSSGYTSIFGAARSIFNTTGLKGFFAGFGATAIRDAPYAGLYVVFYEETKHMLNRGFARTRQDDEADLDDDISRVVVADPPSSTTSSSAKSVPINFVSGLLAAALATAVTNPFDAVKTRLQLMPEQYKNMAHAIRLMVGRDGWGSLMDGVGLRMGRKAMSSALAWSVYEELVKMAEDRVGNRL